MKPAVKMKPPKHLPTLALAAGLLLPQTAAGWAIRPPELLADLLPGPQGSNPGAFEPAAGLVFFRALDAGGTPGLWRTDGSREGTFALDLGGSRLAENDQFAVWSTSRSIFFSALRNEYDPELWVSDGTQAGTTRLAQGLATRYPSTGFPYAAFFEDRNLLFFRGSDFQQGLVGHGPELWVTDGTAAGTLRLADLRPGSEGSLPREFARLGDRLYFLADPAGPAQTWLYATDGTPAGTVPIRGPFYDVGDLVATRDALYFLGLYPEGYGLWRSDGTAAGTIFVADLPAGSHMGRRLFTAHDKLYFPFQSLEHGQELWASDGTAAGTRRLTDFADPERLEFGTSVAEVGERTVFIAGIAKGQVWGTDGTPGGTRALVPCNVCNTSWLLPDGDVAYFASTDDAHGSELWRTDGTPEGTRMLADVAPGATSSAPFAAHPLGGGVAYLADEDGFGSPAAYQMWWAPRTGGAARRLTSFPDQWWTAPLEDGFDGEVLGNRLVFRANDGVHGSEAWVISAIPDCSGDFLCLGAGDRFAVSIEWRLRDGRSGVGHPTRLTTDTGCFWFFGPDNVEVVVKVLDGRALNQHFWLFYGALSDVEFTLTLTDRETGVEREYRNPAGQMASVADTRAIADAGVATGALAPGSVAEEIAAELAPAPAAAGGSCIADEQTLCLQDGRFRVRATWTDFSGNQGVGKAVPLTADTGYFWFFGADNVEVVLKVLDGRPVNDHFWVFYGALSSVEYVLTVTDTVTGGSRTYRNASGELASRADVRALPAE